MAGLFVEVEPGAPKPGGASSSDPRAPLRKTIADLVKDAPGPDLDEVHVPMPTSRPTVSVEAHAAVALQTPPPTADAAAPAPQATGPVVGADGKVDVNAIYQRASLPTVKFTAEQAYDSLHQLP